ncbi:MAG: hypothetical protein KJ971_08665 [Firmicutes bacterium]|nr:hypothetical protein [Bacillota bacterium]
MGKNNGKVKTLNDDFKVLARSIELMIFSIYGKKLNFGLIISDAVFITNVAIDNEMIDFLKERIRFFEQNIDNVKIL